MRNETKSSSEQALGLSPYQDRSESREIYQDLQEKIIPILLPHESSLVPVICILKRKSAGECLYVRGW